MKDEAIALLVEALHLRMHGEFAPGGSENWHDWEGRAEGFLRGLLDDTTSETQSC